MNESSLDEHNLNGILRQSRRDVLAEPDKLAWVTDLSAKLPDVHLLKRGDYFDPGPLVEPGPLSVLVEPENEMSIVPTPAGARTTGRRLAFAEWATRPGFAGCSFTGTSSG